MTQTSFSEFAALLPNQKQGLRTNRSGSRYSLLRHRKCSTSSLTVLSQASRSGGVPTPSDFLHRKRTAV